MGEYTIKYLIDYYQSFVTIEQTIHMNSATVYIVAYISLCICVDALVEDISRIEIGNSEDYLQFTFMNYCQIIFQRSCSNLGFHLQSMRFLFPGCAFFQPMMLAHFKRTAYIAVLFSKYTKLWSFSLLVYQTYATLISLPSTLIRLSSPSPVLRGESLPRVKASFWKTMHASGKIMVSMWWSQFVLSPLLRYVPEMGRDCVGKIASFRVRRPWSPGFESYSASCWLCVFINMWVTNKRRVPGTMPGAWVTKNKARHCTKRFT